MPLIYKINHSSIKGTKKLQSNYTSFYNAFDFISYKQTSNQVWQKAYGFYKVYCEVWRSIGNKVEKVRKAAFKSHRNSGQWHRWLPNVLSSSCMYQNKVKLSLYKLSTARNFIRKNRSLSITLPIGVTSSVNSLMVFILAFSKGRISISNQFKGNHDFQFEHCCGQVFGRGGLSGRIITPTFVLLSATQLDYN